jgi:protocatechuate 3,4-dioxygenase, beta subunit
MTRRGLLAALLALFAPFRLLADTCRRFVEADLGPFYPAEAIPVTNDLFTSAELAARSTVVELTGRVLDASCKPVAGAEVEIWQCDANGQYKHPRAPEVTKLESGFRYFGKTRAAADGTYRFRTMRPAPYGVFGMRRAPHIHMQVKAPGRAPILTEVYFAGAEDDKIRATDGVYRSRGARRAELIVELQPAKSGALHCPFDVTLGSV